MVTSRSEHLSSCILPTATWYWSLLSYQPLHTRVRCDSAAVTAPAGWAKPEPHPPWDAQGCTEELHKHWLSPTLLQPAGSRDAATSSEDGVAEDQWEPFCQRAWNTVNVMILPHFPMQRQKNNRFLKSPATSLHFNSTGWFPSGVLGRPSQQHRAV